MERIYSLSQQIFAQFYQHHYFRGLQKYNFTSYDSFRNLDVGEVPKMSLTTWAENEIKDPMVRNIFYAPCRQQHIRLLLQYN